MSKKKTMRINISTPTTRINLVMSKKSPELDNTHQQSIDIFELLGKVTGEDAEVWVERIGFFIAKLLYRFVCENMGKAFILGSLVGAAFDFSKGMLLSPPKQRLIGGWRNVKGKAILHHGSIVAAHVGLFIVFGLVVPNHPVTAIAAYFGTIRFIHTFDFLKAGLAALAGGFIGFVSKAFEKEGK